MFAVSAIFIDTGSNACSHCSSSVGILCSGLPGCCCERGQGAVTGQGAVGEKVVGESPLCWANWKQ